MVKTDANIQNKKTFVNSFLYIFFIIFVAMFECFYYLCSMQNIKETLKKVQKRTNSVVFCTKEAHLEHINANLDAYKGVFTNQNVLIETIKEAHRVWLHTKEACILNVSFINNIAYEIHKTDLPLFLPFDIDLKGIEGYTPTHKEMVMFMDMLKLMFNKSLVFAYVSKSGKGIHFGLNVDKKAFSSIDGFNAYLSGLEMRICNQYFSIIIDNIETEKVFDRCLYNITEKGISYKNLTISINTEFEPYFNYNPTEPFVEPNTSLHEKIAKYDIVEKQYIAIEVKDDTPVATKTITTQAINDLIASNEGRMKLARYIAGGCLTIERVESVIDKNKKNYERLKELKGTVKLAIKKDIKERGYKVTGTKEYNLYVKNDIKSGYYDVLKPLIKNGYIYPDDYLNAVKGFRNIFVVSENTGAGKTTTLLNAYKDNCLYVVPNISVLNELNNSCKLPVIHSQLDKKDTFYKSGNYIGITYAYLNELIQNNEQYFFNHVANTFKAIVFDEVDYITQTTVYNIERLTQYMNHLTEAQIVFCTATPFKCSLIHDLCDKKVMFNSGKTLNRNVYFYKHAHTENKKNKTQNSKYISVIEWFLKNNTDATNIIYLNNRKLCLRIKDTLKEHDIKLYNSKEKEFELDKVEGNILVTSSITAGLNMYVKDTTKSVNYLMLGKDLTNSLIKQVTGRIRNVNEVNLFLETTDNHKETANTDVRYIHEDKKYCDKELLDVRNKTNINSLISFVEKKYIYHVFDKTIPLSISFYWNKTKDKYNSSMFKLLNTKNYTYNEQVLDVEKTKTKLSKQQVEKYNNVNEINNTYRTEYDKLIGTVSSQANYNNVEITDSVANAINIIAVLCAFFDKQKDALSVFKSAFYTFVNNFQIIKDHFTKNVSWINNESTLKTLVEYNVITNTVANTLTKNKKYSGLYRKLFTIIHTRKCNLLVFKHESIASVIECFLSEFENITSVKLNQTDILGLELFVQQYENSIDVDYTLITSLKTFLQDLESKKNKDNTQTDCEGAVSVSI